MTGSLGAPNDISDRYLALALRLDKLTPGLADAEIVEPELRRRVAAEPTPKPADLVRQAGRLAMELPDQPWAPARREFLAGQLRAVECTARRLAGQPIPFRRELLECFDLVARPGEPDEYAAAHAELTQLLPGSGSLASRLADYRRTQEVPVPRLAAVLAVLCELLRGRSSDLVPLPAQESVSIRVVSEAPWSALHRYRGGYRSEVAVNAGARPRRMQLAQLVAHELYPGHHAERCRKEVGLVARGCVEHRVLLTNSPQSVISEAAAELGSAALLGPGWGRLVADTLDELGLGFDGELAEQVEGAIARLARVRLDAALLLHEEGAPTERVVDHLRGWLLVDERRAHQMLGFLAHPVWRAYTVTYVEGTGLLRRWWDRDPGPARLLRLLDEPLTPTAIRADLAS